MRKLNGFIWLYALAVIASTANADIIIDNQSIPSSDVSSISISPVSGHLYVTTVPGYVITPATAGSNVSITSFTVTPSNMLAGGVTTVNWDVANAVSCTPGGGVGGWGAVNITLPTGSAQITTSKLGVKTFILTCYGTQAGDSASKQANLTVSAPNAVSITSFTASKATLTEGETTTISWATVNATSCTPSGGSGGWNTKTIGLPNGSVPISIPTAGTYTFTLTCHDASAGTDIKTKVVVVSPPATACSTPALSSGTVQSWTSFWAVNFPNPGYDQKYATIPRYSYLALEFNTGNIVSSGKITSVETTVTDGVRFGTFSQCPGDFDVPAACQYMWGIGGGLSWATDGGAGCQLAPNTTYYFNITFTDGVNAATSTCTAAPCITSLQHTIQ